LKSSDVIGKRRGERRGKGGERRWGGNERREQCGINVIIDWASENREISEWWLRVPHCLSQAFYIHIVVSKVKAK
jgi:hypothetical protein